MKRILLLFTIFTSLLLGGCTIYYDSTTPSEEEKDPSTPDAPSQPQEKDPLNIREDALFFPYSINLNNKLIKSYSYIDESQAGKYTIYSAYYSEDYDTLYIAYDDIETHSQTLKAKDLYEIEMHAVNYFESDETRSEDKNYLKAVRIYPDRLASSCRKGLDDSSANNINGCADYGGKEAIIDLNNIKSLSDFYNEKRIRINSTQFAIYEPMRDTFAHEYGHVSTFYHMAYKNDENYEDYLKLRLGDSYNSIYPLGLPNSYSSGSSYYIMPEEILADDFVELFYNTSIKKESDTYDYELEYKDMRNSLEGNERSVQYLKSNEPQYNKVKEYFIDNFFTNSTKKTYETPIVISTNTKTISYYESFSKIGVLSNIKTIISNINVNLIAVGEVTINSLKYYRVILSNTFYCPSNVCNQKDVGKVMGYVLADEYTINNSMKLYAINSNNGSALSKNSIVPINRNINSSNPPTISNVYLIPYYDFSYVLNLSSDSNFAIMYDYLNEKIDNQQYKINIYSFATSLN